MTAKAWSFISKTKRIHFELQQPQNQNYSGTEKLQQKTQPVIQDVKSDHMNKIATAFKTKCY